MKALVVAMALFYLGRRAGRVALGAFRLNAGAGIEAFALETGVGMWLVSLAVFAAGVAGYGACGEIMAALWCLLIAAGAGHARTLFAARRARSAHTPGTPAPDAPWQWALLACVAGFALINAVRCFAPETNFDVLSYHLAVPKAYLQMGRIDYLPTLLYASFPQTAEMLYMAALAFGEPAAAALLHTGFGLLTAALVYAWTARRFSPAAGAVAAAIFSLNPMIGLESPTAMLDLMAAFYSAAAAMLVAVPGESGTRADRATLGALFAGVALSVKWSCFPIVLLCAAWWVWDALAGRRGGKDPGDGLSVSRLAVLAAMCLLPAAPYLIKNGLLTGNPIWPGFGGRDMPADVAGALVRHISGHGGIGPRSLVNFLGLPWDITRNEWAFGGAMSPVFLTFAPLYALVRRNRVVSRLLLFCVLYIPLWYLALNQSLRLLVPIFPLLSVVSAYVYLQFSVKWLQALAGMALALHLGFGAMSAVVGDSGLASEYAVISGREPRQDYLMRTGANLGYEAISWVNTHADPGERVMLGEIFVNGYYLDVPYVWGHPLLQGRYVYRDMRGPGDLDRALRRDGVTRIIFRRDSETLYSDNPQLPAMGPHETRIWKDFLARYTCLDHAGRDTVVRITPAARPGRADCHAGRPCDRMKNQVCGKRDNPWKPAGKSGSPGWRAPRSN